VGDRVELVGVALGAPHRQPHPDLDGDVGPVLDGRDAELLVVRPALGVRHRVPVERGGDQLVLRRVGFAGSGSRSPAICSTVNWSNGLLR
jgi:hypothetical protein